MEPCLDAGLQIFIYTFEYDSLGRPISIYERASDSTIQNVIYKYDGSNRIDLLKYYNGQTTRTVDYNYKSDGTLDSFKPANDDAISFSYDVLDRLSIKRTVHDNSDGSQKYKFDTLYTYQNITSQKTTTLISQLKYSFQNGYGTDYTLDYTYDNLGNIATVNANLTLLASYTYDAPNQLAMEKLHEYPTGNEKLWLFGQQLESA